jgi:cytochrome c oxidase subunit 2
MRLAALALLPLALFVAGCASQIPGLYPPQDVTTQAGSTRNLYDIVFLIAVVIFVFVEALIVYAVLRYRRKPTDTELPPQTHGNNLVEVIWTVIPTAIVMFLFIVSWQTLNTVDATTSNPAVRVVADARRFSWDFLYLDANGDKPLFTTDAQGSGSYGELVVPVGVPIEVRLHSPDVIHAFYVPKFLFKRDVVPGKTNIFDFTVDAGDAGQTFRGQCAELCGIGHGGMTFDVKAVSMTDYQTWLQQQIDQNKANPAPPSGSPASSAGPAGSPAASGATGPTGPVLHLAAFNLAYDTQALEAPAGQAFQIAFANNDPGVPHNIEIKNPDGSDAFKGAIVSGVTTTTYNVPALPAGTYAFQCSVHPSTMTGTLTVK